MFRFSDIIAVGYVSENFGLPSGHFGEFHDDPSSTVYLTADCQ